MDGICSSEQSSTGICHGIHWGRTGEGPHRTLSLSTVQWAQDQSHPLLTYPPPHRYVGAGIYPPLAWLESEARKPSPAETPAPAYLRLTYTTILPLRRHRLLPSCKTRQAGALAQVLVLLLLVLRAGLWPGAPAHSSQVSGKSAPHIVKSDHSSQRLYFLI